MLVLVADDEDGVRTSLAEILRDEGYAVIEAEDGEETLEALRRHPVDVLLLDVRMPKRDGIEVLRALDHPPPVLLISALDLDRAVRRDVEAKVFRFLRKPVPPRLLLDLVSEASAQAS